MMKQLRNIILSAVVLVFAACNDHANDNANNDGSVGGAETRADSTGPTSTEGNATSTGNTSTTLAANDAQFLSDAAASNMAEIKMSQLAQQKGTNQEVKDLAKMLETDHSAVLSDITNMASERSATLPAEEKDDAKSAHNTLNAKTGKEFDKDWCGHMIEMHKKSIAKFENAQSTLTDANLKSWVGNTLPKLRTHLDKLEQCNNKLK